jgi:hypothetical protein
MNALVPRTVSPSLGPCPASGGASSFLLASALLACASATRLLTSRRARRAMRPIDFCHPKRKLRAPAPRMFPAFASAAFTAWAPRRVWALRGLTGGPSVSRRPRPLRRIGRDASLLASRSGAGSPPSFLAWALSSHGAFAIEPLTSLSPLLLLPAVPLAFARCSGKEGAAKTTVTFAP